MAAGGHYGAFRNGARIGSVMRFAGEPAARRWVASSVHTTERRAFKTLRDASQWLQQVAESAERSQTH